MTTRKRGVEFEDAVVLLARNGWKNAEIAKAMLTITNTVRDVLKKRAPELLSYEALR